MKIPVIGKRISTLWRAKARLMNAVGVCTLTGALLCFDCAYAGASDDDLPADARGSARTQPHEEIAASALELAANAGAREDAAPTPAVQSGARTLFPLHVEKGKRYLVDRAGHPFLLAGDTPSSLAVQLTQGEVIQYLDDRKSRGFNTILFELIEHKFADNPPYNAYGEAPFYGKLSNANGSACIATSSRWSRLLAKLRSPLSAQDCWDFSKPNEAYWKNVDFVVKEATARGFLILAEPSFLGYAGRYKGWYQEMVANGPTALQSYGAFLAERYKTYNNIIWVEGGDFVPPASGTALVEAIANGIRDVLPESMHTVHTIRGSAALDYWFGEPWVTVNVIYSDELPYAQAKAQYKLSDMPFFLIESYYEGESADEARLRSQAYQALLTGAFGQLLGHDTIYPMLAGWQRALDSPGAQSMTNLVALLSSLKWWLLMPDDGTLIASGQSAASSFAPAAIASDKSFALVYFATKRSLGLNLAAFSGPQVRARWFDPSVGRYLPATEHPFPAAGTMTFTPIGDNAHGFADWVLLLESVP